MMVTEGLVEDLVETRARDPQAIRRAALARRRRPLVGPSGRLVIVAADHPARGALAAGGDPVAMADRVELLRRLLLALSRPGVDGILATADVVEDLLLLGGLDDKVVIGSMNRGGLAGAAFEIDDRVTGYQAAGIEAGGLDGGKLLLRVDLEDPATASTIETCGRAVTDLAARGLMAMVEPFVSRRVEGRVVNDLSPESMIKAIAVASGLGSTSAWTWLKVPVVDDMERVMRASTLPALILGGDVGADPADTFGAWEAALRMPTVRGVVAGRSLLFPPDGDVVAAVDTAVRLVAGAGSIERHVVAPSASAAAEARARARGALA